MFKNIILIILIVLLGGGIFLYIKNAQESSNPTVEQSSDSGFKSFFSFIQNNNSEEENNNTNEEGNNTESNENTPSEDNDIVAEVKFQQLTDFAVAGLETFIDSRPLPESAIPSTGTTTGEQSVIVPDGESVSALRYVARSNGHVYGQYLDTGASNKVSNSTIPTIYEAFFGNNADTVIYRYLANDNKTIQTFFAKLGGEVGQFLPENIDSLSVTPDGGRFFYTIKSGNDLLGYIASFADPRQKVQVFSSPFTEWLPQWGGPSTIFLTTKPSWNTLGSIYYTEIQKGNFVKLFGGQKGLTTLVSLNGTSVLYGSNTNTVLELGVYNILQKTYTSLPLRTLPEKCVWARDNITAYCAMPNNIESARYPDDWYKGNISFTDSIVKVDTIQKSFSVLANSEENIPVDGIKLTLSKDETKLFLINKKDSTLWSLNLQ